MNSDLITTLKDSIEELKIDIINNQLKLDLAIEHYQELNNLEYDDEVEE